MKKSLFTLILACLTAFAFASPPEPVPKPEVNANQVIYDAPSFDAIQLATIDHYALVYGEAPCSYLRSEVEPALIATKEAELKITVWDYGNNRYRCSQGYNNKIIHPPNKAKIDPLLKLDKLLVS